MTLKTTEAQLRVTVGDIQQSVRKLSAMQRKLQELEQSQERHAKTTRDNTTTLDGLKKAFSPATAAVGGMTVALAAVTAAAVKAGTELIKLTKRGQQVDVIARGFERVASPTLLARLQTATRGLVSDTMLMQEASQALRGGLVDEELLVRWSRAMSVAAKQTGQGLDDLMEDFGELGTAAGFAWTEKLGVNMTAIEERVEQLGIMASDSSGQLLMLEEVLKELERSLGGLDDEFDRSQGVVDRAEIAWTNYYDTVGRSLAQHEGYQALIDGISQSFDGFGVSAEDVGRAIGDTFVDAFYSFNAAVGNVAEGIKGLIDSPFFQMIVNVWDDARHAIVRMNEALSAIGMGIPLISWSNRMMDFIEEHGREGVESAIIQSRRYDESVTRSYAGRLERRGQGQARAGESTDIAQARMSLRLVQELTRADTRRYQEQQRQEREAAQAAREAAQQRREAERSASEAERLNEEALQQTLLDTLDLQDQIADEEQRQLDLQIQRMELAAIERDAEKEALEKREEAASFRREEELAHFEKLYEMEVERAALEEKIAELEAKQAEDRNKQIQTTAGFVTSYFGVVAQAGNSLAGVFGQLASIQEEGSKEAERYGKIQGGILAGISFVKAAMEVAAVFENFGNVPAMVAHGLGAAGYIAAGVLALSTLGGSAKQGSGSAKPATSFTASKTRAETETAEPQGGGTTIVVYTMSSSSPRLGRELQAAEYQLKRSGLDASMVGAGSYGQ